VTLKRDGKQYTILRTWRPNTLTLKKGDNEPRVVTQDRIDRLLGCHFEAFVGLVLMGQFNDFFFDLSPTEKLSLFSNAMGLEYWVERADKARDLAKGAASTVEDCGRRLAELEGRIKAQTEVRTEWANLKLHFEEDRRNTIRKLKKDERQLVERYEQVSAALKELKVIEKGRQEILEVTQKAVIDYEKKLNDSKQDLRDKDRQLDDLKDKKRELLGRLEELEAKPEKCPTCGSRMDERHFNKEKGKIQAMMRELSSRIQEVAGEADRTERKQKQLEDEAKQMNTRLPCRKMEAKDFERQVRSKDSELHELGHDVERIRKDILDEETRENPYPEKLRTVKRQIEQAKDELREQRKLQAAAEEQQRQGEQWAKLFKDLRLWLIEDAVRELQQEIENSLMQLGLQDWRVECVVEKASDKGKLKRGFEVLIRSPQSNGKAIPWKSACGGETQRLRIASARGFQSLLRSRMGQRFNVEVWDEPTAHIAEEGLTDLLGFFEGIVRDEQRSLYLIDHRTLRAGNFDGGVRIVNTDSGSVIKVLEIV
jgi:DNA repair exonuclease SbcCD ATPase subunit